MERDVVGCSDDLNAFGPSEVVFARVTLEEIVGY